MQPLRMELFNSNYQALIGAQAVMGSRPVACGMPDFGSAG
jgi:hypothetical protein